ncbi:hypothetical protein [Bacillus sp. FJAT-18017]|uniref:hypothetical protein n=1 Tax=Bacillus sp. FJAT-18017 TaxID=1705566 RepID=UPI0012E11EC0|nr:hypothetical protein [Bacillus sp. FJAT-18017]
MAITMDIGGSGGAFSLLVPILAGFIAMSIADRPGFAPARLVEKEDKKLKK